MNYKVTTYDTNVRQTNWPQGTKYNLREKMITFYDVCSLPIRGLHALLQNGAFCSTGIPLARCPFMNITGSTLPRKVSIKLIITIMTHGCTVLSAKHIRLTGFLCGWPIGIDCLLAYMLDPAVNREHVKTLCLYHTEARSAVKGFTTIHYINSLWQWCWHWLWWYLFDLWALWANNSTDSMLRNQHFEWDMFAGHNTTLNFIFLLIIICHMHTTHCTHRAAAVSKWYCAFSELSRSGYIDNRYSNT